MRFEILGPLRVHTNAGEVTISSGRERTLLAMLLLHANRTVPNDQLIEAIWAEQPPPGARNQLQGCVSRLRKRLATTGLVIITEPSGYRANLPPADLDLLEFRRLVSQARTATATGDHPASVAGYRAALDLWRGPALGGTDTGSAHAAVALDEEHVQVQEEYIEAELAAGGAGRLVPELTELVGQHPHRERLHRVLMLALYRADRQADALAAYRHARTILHDELGIEPGAELQRLHQAILTRDPDLDAPPIPAHASAAGSAQPPVPRELPADVAGFTGRTEALDALDELLDRDPPHGPPAPVVISAIAGTAGVGKTALAVHWAHRVADRFPHGQLYLNLRGYATTAPVRPIEALSALLRSLGTPPEQIPTDEVQAAALYRTQLADRGALVLLDNARSVDQIRPLLPGASGCLVLITSRDRLTGLIARDGATRLTLDVLTPEEAQTLLSNLLGPDRATAEPAATDELARACAYLPLALRIAAAHLIDRPDRPIGSYVRRLTMGDRLTALRANGDDESSVLTTLSLSYRALPPNAARLFRLLGLVPGPDFTSASAASLAATTTSEATRLLQRLAHAHLVDEHAAGRYAFHDLLRIYAGRLTAVEDEDGLNAARRRLFDHYLHGADLAASHLNSEMLRLPVPLEVGAMTPIEFSGPSDAAAWLNAERANLIATAVYAAECGPRSYAWLLSDCLRGYFWRSRRTTDWLRVASAAQAAAVTEGDQLAQAASERCLADLELNVGRSHEAMVHYASAADLARQADWTDGEAAVLTNLGILSHQLGRVSQAAEHFAQALALDRRNGRVDGQAVNINNLGRANYELGRLVRAADEFSQAASLHRQLGSVSGEADSLNNLGEVAHDLGRLDDAIDHLSRAQELHQLVGDRAGVASALASLASVHLDVGRLPHAFEQASNAVALAAEIDAQRLEARARNTLASIHLHLGRPDIALALHGLVIELTRGGEMPALEISALLGLGSAHHRLGNYNDGLSLAQRAYSLAGRVGYHVLEGKAQTLMAAVLLGQGRLADADEHARLALEIHEETGYRLGQVRTHVVLGQVMRTTHGIEAARWCWRTAAAISAEIGVPVPDDPLSAHSGRG